MYVCMDGWIDVCMYVCMCIMNHDSGFIIGIARKLCVNPNRTLTK